MEQIDQLARYLSESGSSWHLAIALAYVLLKCCTYWRIEITICSNAIKRKDGSKGEPGPSG